MTDDISIGAIGAALIAGLISLLGLIISKEQKTSEFRQAWVDSLRSEITAYLTSFNAIADAVAVPYKDQAEKVKALSPLYSKFNEAGFAITLRVNPKEKKSQAVMTCMREFNKLASNEATMTPGNIRPIEKTFLTASKDLLKYEWNRVKRGELTFILTKIIAAIVVLAALWYVLTHAPHVATDKTAHVGTTIFNNVSNIAYPTEACAASRLVGISALAPQPAKRSALTRKHVNTLTCKHPSM